MCPPSRCNGCRARRAGISDSRESWCERRVRRRSGGALRRMRRKNRRASRQMRSSGVQKIRSTLMRFALRLARSTKLFSLLSRRSRRFARAIRSPLRRSPSLARRMQCRTCGGRRTHSQARRRFQPTGSWQDARLRKRLVRFGQRTESGKCLYCPTTSRRGSRRGVACRTSSKPRPPTPRHKPRVTVWSFAVLFRQSDLRQPRTSFVRRSRAPTFPRPLLAAS